MVETSGSGAGAAEAPRAARRTGGRGLLIVVIVWAVLLWLATTPLGAIVGFFEGITVAFFVAPLIYLLHVPEAALGLIFWSLLGVWEAWALVMAGVGVFSWRSGDKLGARGTWAFALSLDRKSVV